MTKEQCYALSPECCWDTSAQGQPWCFQNQAVQDESVQMDQYGYVTITYIDYGNGTVYVP